MGKRYVSDATYAVKSSHVVLNYYVIRRGKISLVRFWWEGTPPG